MFYCSSDHQKKHWRQHKYICNYMFNAAMADSDQQHFFSGHSGKTRQEWNMFRMNAVKTCSIILSRPLELCEQEAFLFPRVCRTEGCYSAVARGDDTMLMCDKCQVTVWCSHQHKKEAKEQHDQVR